MLSVKQRTILQIVFAMVVITFALLVDSMDLSDTVISRYAMDYGYIGILLVSIVSGFNLLVPVPIIAFLPFFVSLGLHPFLTILLIAFGMSIGDILGYIIGRGGRKVLDVESTLIIKRLEQLKKKNRFLPAIIMFVYAAFVPAPNEIIMIPLGFMKTRGWIILTAAFLGNIIFNIFIGYGLLAGFGG